MTLFAGGAFASDAVSNSDVSKSTSVRSQSQRKSTGGNSKNTKTKSMNNSFQTPDFAFPRDVDANAEKALVKATSEGNWTDAVRAVVQMTIARDMVSNDNAPAQALMIDSLALKAPEPYRSLLYLLEGGLYQNIYSYNSWKFRSRTLPIDSYPENPMDWSADLFALKVLSLVEKGQQNYNTLAEIPLKEIAPLLTDTASAVAEGMTVEDFMCVRSADLLSKFIFNSEAVIPFGAPSAGNRSVSDRCRDCRDLLLRRRYDLDVAAGNVASAVRAAISLADIKPYNQRLGFALDVLGKFNGSDKVAPLLTYISDFYDIDSFDKYSSDLISVGVASEMPDIKTFYKTLTDFRIAYPDAPYVAGVDNAIAKLGRQSVSLGMDHQWLTTKALADTVHMTNTNELYLLLVKLPSRFLNNDITRASLVTAGKIVDTRHVSVEGQVPFKGHASFDFGRRSPGIYAVVPSLTKDFSGLFPTIGQRENFSSFIVSDINVIHLNNNKSDSRLIVVNGENMAPVKGADVSVFDRRWNSKDRLVSKGKTDTDGSFILPSGNYNVQVSYGENLYSSYFYSGRSDNSPDKRNYNAEILTDLSIYHPGDSVGFAAVMYSVLGQEISLARNNRIVMKLRDANWQIADSLSLTTDADGRVEGSFKIPSDGLLGNFSIVAYLYEDSHKQIGGSFFQVADYKSPTFKVTLEGDSESVEIDDVVRVKGKVMTYSGVPLGEVDVNFNVKYEPAWWFWRSEATNATYGASVKSDAEGNFIIELPTASLKGTPYSRGTFSLVATAVSPSGESQESSPYRFVIGKTASVGLERFPSSICVAGTESKPVDIDIPVYNALRNPVKGVDVEWYAVDEKGVEVASGSFRSPEFDFDFASLPSGKYKFTFFPHEMQDNKKSTSLVVYRKSDVKTPYATPLWVPEKSVTVADDAAYVDICVGSAYPDSYVLCSVAGSDGTYSWRWLEINAENKSVRVDLSRGAGVTHVSLMGMHDLNEISEEVAVSRQYVLRSMKIESESFRDRITPGDREQWRFRMSIDGTQCVGDPAMAVMSNQALNAIAPFRWSFNPRDGIRMNFVQSVSTGWNSSYSWNYTLKKVNYKNEKRFLSPKWNFYGYSLYGGPIHIRGTRMYLSSANVISADEVVDEVADFTAGPKKMKMAKMESAAPDSNENVEFELEEEGVNTAAAGADSGAAAASEPVRQIEMPLAFFRPMLKADADGVVNIDFTVPNFNTTWQLQLLGYDSQLYSSVATFNTVAAKKVMVQCNAPRFLRSGDVTVISATLFNNSGAEVAVGGRIEIFDPLSGEILKSESFAPEGVAASGNRSVDMTYTVPADRTLVGVRAFAEGDGHSDGEQTAVDILPSSNPVIESDPFYLAPGEHEFEMKLPKVDADASLTLQYCDNPVWYCVTALPDISNPDSKNLFALLPALFGNSVGLGLAERYPQIRQALQPVEGDSLLVSNLYKNPQLKSVALNSTPWVNNAAAESLRMGRLQELLDKKKGDEVVKSLLKSISDLQNSDGGWSWCPDMKSSFFMTSAALLNFAMLRDMKCLDSSSDIDSMIDKGIRFCRSEIVKDYNRDPKYFSYESMLDYLYIESFFGVKSSNPTFNTIRSKALKAIAEGWRNYGIYEKATAAMLLYRSGNAQQASVILESLGQFASSSPEKGVWFDNLSSGFTGWPRLITTAQALEAFNEINPSSRLIDGLRQWLILSRQTEDWGTNRYTSEVIYSILTTGSDWLADAAPAVIALNGKEVALGKRERLTGSVSIQLSPKEASGAKLTVSRGGDSPAWGGLISQYVAPIEDIKAASIPDLSVSKEVLLLKSTPDGNVAEKCSEFKVGDKVRVTLTVHCGRDMDYVALTDCRAACMEPADQVSGYTAVDGLWFYKEIRNTATNLFFDFLPKGNHVITYDCFIDRAGEYSLGIATIQSQYSPLMTAHSAGSLVVSE